jgi:predicted methyltransferase
MRRLLFLILGLLATSVWPFRAAAQTKPLTMEEMHKLHQDPKAYIASLEDPARDGYQKPHEVVMALGLREGERIADIGAGAGYFTLRFAHHVGATGLVVAVDISPEMIVHLNWRVRDTELDNVRTVLALPDDPLLSNASVDCIFICDTWHHIEKRAQYLTTLKKALRPGGQIVIIDFQKKKTPVGPPMEMRLPRDEVVRELEQNGFRLLKEHAFLPYQYFLVFSPTAAVTG